MTEWAESTLYEGFYDAFQTEFELDLQREGQADHFKMLLQRGQHSGHLKLTVELLHSEDSCA